MNVKNIYDHLQAKYLDTFRSKFDEYVIPIESENALVIIEPRMHPYLEFTIKNVCFYVPGWKLYVFHSKKNLDYLEGILGKNSSNVHFIEICEENLTIEQYNKLLVSADFWNQIDAKHILIFQTDSYMLKSGLDKYLAYDYVGAPWGHWGWVDKVTKIRHYFQGKCVGYGGFSLRKKEVMLEIINKCPYENDPEDIYFSKNCYALGKNMPSIDVAKEFSVEGIPFASPMATHKWWINRLNFQIASHLTNLKI